MWTCAQQDAGVTLWPPHVEEGRAEGRRQRGGRMRDTSIAEVADPPLALPCFDFGEILFFMKKEKLYSR